MGVESGRNSGATDRNVETSATGGCSDGKALSHSSCRDGVENYRFQCPACSSSRAVRIPVRGVRLRTGVTQPVAKARWFPPRVPDCYRFSLRHGMIPRPGSIKKAHGIDSDPPSDTDLSTSVALFPLSQVRVRSASRRRPRGGPVSAETACARYSQQDNRGDVASKSRVLKLRPFTSPALWP
jgi:hypothetical protein